MNFFLSLRVQLELCSFGERGKGENTGNLRNQREEMKHSLEKETILTQQVEKCKKGSPYVEFSSS